MSSFENFYSTREEDIVRQITLLAMYAQVTKDDDQLGEEIRGVSSLMKAICKSAYTKGSLDSLREATEAISELSASNS